MFKNNKKAEEKVVQGVEVLSKKELEELKSAFSGFSLNGKDASSNDDESYEIKVGDSQQWQSRLYTAFSRAKNTFYDLNSRSFSNYAKFASFLNLRKELQERPELSRINLAVNALEILSIIMCIAMPRKWVNKTLLGMGAVTVHFYYLQKFMLNYYVEQIALYNSRMEPVEQEARNLIEYKYTIQRIEGSEGMEQEVEPYVKWILEQVEKKNLEYLRFKKVELLV